MKKSIVYTMTGDSGTTSLVGGKRVMKNDVRLEAYGCIDELNSELGYFIVIVKGYPNVAEFLRIVQNKLFNIGAYLATDNPDNIRTEVRGLSTEDVTNIETMIDSVDGELPPLQNFVLPGGSKISAVSHLCRTTTRRCERRIVDLAETQYVDVNILKFINRLSDFFFVFARFNNIHSQIEEKFWDKDC